MKSLAKEPHDRFPSMEEFRKAFLGEIKLAGARPARAAARSARRRADRRRCRRRRRRRCPRPRRRSTTTRAAQAKTGRASASSAPRGGGGVVGVLHVPKATTRRPTPRPRATPAPAPPRPSRRRRGPARGKTGHGPLRGEPDGRARLREAATRRTWARPLDVKLPQTDPPPTTSSARTATGPTLTADPSEDRTVHVALEKLEAPPRPPPAEPREAPRGGAHHRRRQAQGRPSRRRRPRDTVVLGRRADSSSDWSIEGRRLGRQG